MTSIAEYFVIVMIPSTKSVFGGKAPLLPPASPTLAEARSTLPANLSYFRGAVPYSAAARDLRDPGFVIHNDYPVIEGLSTPSTSTTRSFTPEQMLDAVSPTMT